MGRRVRIDGKEWEVTTRLGVLGLGSVFWTPYRSLIQRLALDGRVELVAGFDPDPAKRAALAGAMGGVDVDLPDAESLIARDDVDAVLVLTSMLEHSGLATAALRAGKHVLVEKPMATALDDGRQLLEASREAPGRLVCAPHIVLSPSYREMHRRIHAGVIGRPLSARGRYGWSGPWWGAWFYRRGGGALFDLGIYNLTSLCGFFGPVKRVTALVGTAIPERVVEGQPMTVEADDNAHVLLDFGDARFASVMTGFTIQKYRSPALEVYGTEGVLQMMGDDWAPEGLEQWRNEAGVWELVPETEPTWPWTDGLRHLVDCIERDVPPVNRPEHAYHALEVVLAAVRSAQEGRVVEIESDFPPLDYSTLPAGEDDERRVHDPRTLV
jgi:predicted dehydrogenase